jgi:hypothetical protein
MGHFRIADAGGAASCWLVTPIAMNTPIGPNRKPASAQAPPSRPLLEAITLLAIPHTSQPPMSTVAFRLVLESGPRSVNSEGADAVCLSYAFLHCHDRARVRQ